MIKKNSILKIYIAPAPDQDQGFIQKKAFKIIEFTNNEKELARKLVKNKEFIAYFVDI